MASPFKFLDPYGKADRNIFFGRDREIGQLYEQVFLTNLVLVYGASGTGKTSLVQAGLAQKFAPTDWLPIMVRREGNINESLRRALRDKARLPPPDSLLGAVRSVYLDHYKPLYLIFDQFEELFTHSFTTGDARDAARSEATQFFQDLQALTTSGLQAKVLLVIREEYLASLSNFEDLVPSLFDNRLRVEPMSRKNLREVVTGTAGAFDVRLEPQAEAVANAILDRLAAPGERPSLTHLQVYLDRLWRDDTARRGEPAPRKFDLALVEQTGQIENVLADFLAESIAQLEVEIGRADVPRQLLYQLVTDQGTKRRWELANLREIMAERGVAQADTDRLIEALLRRRLLRRSEQKREKSVTVWIELAHDSLAAIVWDMMSGEEKTRRRLETLVRRRYADRQAGGGLLTREDLELIAPLERQLRLSTEERDFVRKSRQKWKARRRNRLIAAFAFVGVLAAGAVVYTAFRTQARIRSSLDLVLRAQQEVERVDPTRAREMVARAREIDDNAVAQDAWFRLQRQHIFYEILHRADSGIGTAAFSDDGNYWAYASPDGPDVVLGSGTKVLHRLRAHKAAVNSLAFSQDGTSLLSAGSDRVVRRWRVDNGKQSWASSEATRPFTRVAWLAPRRFAAVEAGGKVHFWNDTDVLGSLPALGAVDDLATTDSFVYVLQYDRVLRGSWRNPDWETAFDHAGELRAISVKDGALGVLTAGADLIYPAQTDTIRFSLAEVEGPKQILEPRVPGWFVASGKAVFLQNIDGSRFRALVGHREKVIRVIEAEHFAFTAAADSTIRRWHLPMLPDPATYRPTFRFPPVVSSENPAYAYGSAPVPIPPAIRDSLTRFDYETRPMTSADVEKTSESWAFGDVDGTVTVIDKTGRQSKFPDHSLAVNTLAFSPAGTRLASGGNDGRAVIRRLDGSKALIIEHDLRVRALAWSSDGTWLLSGSQDRTVYRTRVADASAEPKLFTRHPGGVLGLAFSSDGSYLASVDDRGYLQLKAWRDDVSEAIQILAHDGPAWGIRALPAGRWLTAGADGRVKIWQQLPGDDGKPHLYAVSDLPAGGEVIYVGEFSEGYLWLGLKDGEMVRWRVE